MNREGYINTQPQIQYTVNNIDMNERKETEHIHMKCSGWFMTICVIRKKYSHHNVCQNK